MLNYVSAGIDVLFDDREGVSVGEKFNDSDLIGIPSRLIVSARNIAKSEVEFVDRTTDTSKMLSDTKVIEFLKGNG